MGEQEASPVTRLLLDWSNGDENAVNALMPLVYEELRRLARSYMRGERTGHTLQTTGLVHEAYLRLVDQRAPWKSRAHFFGIAAQMMRRILVDHAKANQSIKRGAGVVRLNLDAAFEVAAQPGQDLALLDQALSRFEQIDPRASRIVELRFFGGLSAEETSEVLGISTATVQRQWRSAKVWLHHALAQDQTT